jgi:hypothetical protein
MKNLIKSLIEVGSGNFTLLWQIVSKRDKNIVNQAL